jgi:Family of unknown function (DUF6441)
MKLVFSADESIFQRWLKELQKQIEEAKAGAVQDAAALAIAEGRANVAGAGFPARWQAAVRSRFYPNKQSGDPAAIVFDVIPFAGVFETGATIQGRPLLWLPIGGKAGVRSPRQYPGRLVSVNVRGKPPLLFDAAKRKLGPLFVGVRTVTLRKRLDIARILKLAAERVGEFYEQRIKD